METISAANLNGGKAWAYIMMSHTRRAKERVRGTGGAQHFFGAVVKQTQAYRHLFHAAGACIKAFVLVLVTSQKCVPETFVFPKKRTRSPPVVKTPLDFLRVFVQNPEFWCIRGQKTRFSVGCSFRHFSPFQQNDPTISHGIYDRLLTAVTPRVRRT